MRKPLRTISILLALVLCLATTCAAVNPLSYPKFRAWDPTTGAPLAEGKLYSYYPGGETPKNIYSDSGLTTAHPNNPLTLNSNGEATIYLSGSTKLVLKTSTGASVWTMDSVTTPNDYFIDAAAYGSNQAGIEAAITSIGANNRTLNISPGTWSITGDMVIPSNIALRMDNGAVLAIATTKTLTINGSLEAGLYQIFSCIGTGKVVFGDGAVDFVRCEWWGAVPNGTTDCLSAMQAAVDSFPVSATSQPTITSGGKLCLATGKYKITGPLTIGTTSRNVTLEGVNSGASIIYNTGATFAVVAAGVDAGATYTKNIHIKNIKFQSANTAQNAGTGAISLKYMHYFEIDHCWFMGEDYYAIYVEDTLDGHIHHNRIDTQASDGVGYYKGINLVRVGALGAPNQITIDNNYIEDTYYAAIQVYGGATGAIELVTIKDNLVQSNERYGVLFDKINRLSIVGNYFEANGQSNVAGVADIFDAGSAISSNIEISQNKFSIQASSGAFSVVNLSNIRGGKIDNNYLGGGSTQTITLGATVKGVSIANNTAAVQPTLTITPTIPLTNNCLVDGTLWTGYRDSGIVERQALAYGTTVTPNIALGRFIQIDTVTGNLKIDNPTNMKDRDTFTVEFRIDGTGGYALTWGTQYRILTAGAMTASKRNLFTFYYDGTEGLIKQISASVGTVI